MADAAAAPDGASGLIHAAPNGMDELPGLSLPEHLLHPGLRVTAGPWGQGHGVLNLDTRRFDPLATKAGQGLKFGT